MSEEKQGTQEIRFVFEGLTASRDTWEREIEGLLMGGKVTQLSVTTVKRIGLETP